MEPFVAVNLGRRPRLARLVSVTLVLAPVAECGNAPGLAIAIARLPIDYGTGPLDAEPSLRMTVAWPS